MANYNGLINISTTWTNFKSIVGLKKIGIQFEETASAYEIFAVDSQIVYFTIIFKGSVPDASYDQGQNDADKTDFETSYKDATTTNRTIGISAAVDGYAITTTNPTLVAGSDGSLIRTITTDSSGRPTVVGAGTAGTPVGGLLTIQGHASGTPIPVTGAITANNPSVSTNNAAAPSSSTQIGGTDGTNLQASKIFDLDTGGGTDYNLGFSLRLPSSGGSVAGGTSTDPVRIDPTGTTTQPVSGTVTANIGTTNGLALDATLTGGTARTRITDGTNNSAVINIAPTTEYGLVVRNIPSGTQTISGTVTANAGTGTFTVGQATAANLNAQVQGTAADGAAVSGNPVLIAGYDGTNTRTLRTLSDGSVQTRYKELATFTALATSVVIGNNKSMISIVNTSGSTVVARISSIHIINVQTSAVTGIAGTFELRRIVSHSGGTQITAIEKMDSTDALNSSITVRTGATVGTESTTLLWRSLFSTDEWGPGTSDVESGDHSFQTMFPVWNRKDYDNKPIILRANEGLTIKFATNSTAGTFDILTVLTQE